MTGSEAVQSDEWCILSGKQALGEGTRETEPAVNTQRAGPEDQVCLKRASPVAHTRGPPGRDGVTTTSTAPQTHPSLIVLL